MAEPTFPEREQIAPDRPTTEKDIAILYRELLGREPPTEAETAASVGKPLLQFAVDLVRSREHVARLRATTSDDVARLYRELLGREPESPAVYANNVGKPLAAVAIAIARSAEFATKVQHQALRDIAAACELQFPDEPADPNWLEEFTRIVNFHRLRWPAVLRQLDRMRRQRNDPATLGAALRCDGWPLIDDKSCGVMGPLHPEATLVVPTVNSERWLEPFLEFYRAAELDPVYAIDARTSDGTRELIESHGLRTIEVRGGAERVEALMPAIAAGITTPWCLRIDDDELPTAELIASVGRIAGGEDAAPVAFARAQLHYDAATAALERSHFIAYGPDAAFDCQTRLFRPLAVQFTERLHSPGFEVVRRRLAPTEAQILHFDWVLRSKVQRGAKLARYESQSADLASQCRHFTVPDLIPPAWHIFDAVPSPRLMAFARSIHLLAERAAGLGSG